MTRMTFLGAIVLGLGAVACVGSLEDMEAAERADALGSNDSHYKHVDLPGTCREFDTLTLKADGSYQAKLASGAQENGSYKLTATKLRLKPVHGFTRNYGFEGDEFAFQLTRKGCNEVLEAAEAEDPTNPGTPTDPGVDPACAERTGGALVTFDVHGETLRVWTTNQSFVTRAKELVGNEDFHPTPMFERVIAGYDACSGRQWHVDPERVGFADFTTEVCDAVPSYIDANRDAWVTAPGNYCPWGPRVISVEAR